jgi:hypothetical protein
VASSFPLLKGAWLPPEPEIVELNTTSLPSITFVDGDDWEGLYLDGKLVDEGHHVRLGDIFRHLGIAFNVIYPDMEWLGERGNLPQNLDEVEEE